MPDAWVDPALAGVGALGSFFTGRSAAKASKEALRRQAQLIGKQSNLFGQTAPYYQALLGAAAQNIGLGAGPQGQGVNEYGNAYSPYQPGNLTGVRSEGYGGQQPVLQGQQNYGGLTPEDNLRLKAAEEDINRQAQHNANQLRFNANLSGLNTGAVGAGLARNEQEALRNYAQFRRGLAIQAPEMQQQRLANFANLLSPGFGLGSAASAGYGQQGALYGNQANQAFAGVGQALQNYQYQRNLRKYGQNNQGIPNGWTG